jgi:hypothetical protein
MGSYKERDLDFIIRTRKILKQYDALFSNIEEKDYYNVTLFINCCIGLIIIPRQELNQEIPTEIINEDKHGISTDSITLIKENVKQFNYVVSHIRNSISHNNFYMDGQDNKIDRILFEDYLPGQNGIQTFKAEISFEGLKKFALFLSNVYVGKMAKKLVAGGINAYMEKYYPDDLHNH